ncbi:MAG: MBG domain-containing protein [Bacteroidales bacterium]|nr:MBG domain-containing protein [Bacteroidales bacterium]
MKKIFTLMISALMLGITGIQAQQIKGDFDKQTPWGAKEEGVVPDGWDALNVIQMGMEFPLVFGDTGRDGAGKSVKMKCQLLGLLGIGANSPSYITLGKTWVYADVAGVMSQSAFGDKSDPDDSDGGSIGGIDFTYRPDSIVGYYKRTHGTEKPDEIAQIIVYSWKGTCSSQAPTTGEGDHMWDKTEDLPLQTLVDRDIDILGVKNGNVPADGITLISKKLYSIEGNLEDWTRISVPIDYLKDEAPEKLNVIISTSDYFNRPNLGKDNTLWADDVRFIYNAKLKSVTVGGVALDSFDEDVFEYVLPEADAAKEVVAEAYGANANVVVGELQDSKRTITVTDDSSNGQKTYTYTLTYKGAPAVITWGNLDESKLVYGETVELAPQSENQEGTFTYTVDNSNVAEIVDGKIHFIGVGDVNVVARQAAAGNYSPSISQPLAISVKKAPLTIGVKDITRVYSYVTDKFEFTYEGLKNNDADKGDKIFTTKPTASIPEQTLPNGDKLTSSRGVYVGEYEITVAGAEAANYEISYTKGTLTVTPAAAVAITIKKFSNINVGDDIPQFTISYSNLIGNDKLDESLVFSTLPTVSTTATSESPAGKYDVVFTPGELTDAAKKNYQDITYTNGTLTIIGDPVVDVTGIDDLVYGRQDPFTIAVTANGEPITEFTVTEHFIQNTGNAGEYKVLGVGEDTVRFVVPATDITREKSVEEVINIKKAQLTITAKDVSCPFGGIVIPDEYELVYEGFVGDDNETNSLITLPVVECDVTTDARKGDEFAIVPSGAESDKYDFVYNEGKFTITSGVDIVDGEVSGVQVYYADGNLYVEGNDASEAVFIYTSQGSMVAQCAGDESVIPVRLIKDTVYLVKIGSYVTRILAK